MLRIKRTVGVEQIPCPNAIQHVRNNPKDSVGKKKSLLSSFFFLQFDFQDTLFRKKTFFLSFFLSFNSEKKHHPSLFDGFFGLPCTYPLTSSSKMTHRFITSSDSKKLIRKSIGYLKFDFRPKSKLYSLTGT